MKLNKTVTGLFLIIVITISFATLIHRQKNSVFSIRASKSISPSTIFDCTTYNMLAVPMLTQQLLAAFSLEVNSSENSAIVLDNSTRAEVYNFIRANPGFQFRGICNQLGISIGLAEFHLGVLKKAGLISFFRDGRYKRFFESKKFSQKKMKLISLLRHDTIKNIIKTILDKKQISHGELACQLSITSQGVTWQMNHLKKGNIIREEKEYTKTIYSIKETYKPVLSELVKLVEQTQTGKAPTAW